MADSTNYEYDSSTIEVSGGQANLKSVDILHSESDFELGTHVGSYYDSTTKSISMLDKTSDALDVRSLFPSKSSSLVGYWRFDNNSNDSSGRGNDLTMVGGSFSNFSKVGDYSGHFNNNAVAIIKDSDMMPTSKFTFSAWVHSNDLANGRRIIAGNSDAGGSSFSILVDPSGTKWRLHLSEADDDSIQLYSSSKIPQDVWTNITVVADGSKLKLYMNGVLDNEKTYDGTIKPVTTCWGFGARPRSADCSTRDQRWIGYIDEVALWDDALDEDQVSKLYSTQLSNFAEHSSDWTPHWDDLVGLYNMESSWMDLSGNSNHGTAVGETTFSDSSKVGSKSGLFDGGGDEVILSASSEYIAADNQPFTMVGWARPKSIASGLLDDRVFTIHRGSSDGSGLSVGFGNDNKIQFYNHGDSSYTNWDTLVKTDQWHFIGLVYTGSCFQPYLNGKKDGACTTKSLLAGGSFPARIGSYHGTNINYHGYIDDMAFWSTGLDESDVALIYNRQKQKFAASYQSPVIDMGTAQNITTFSTKTALPFNKELTALSESVSDYPDISGDLSVGLAGYWPLDEISLGTVGGYDFEDKSNNNNHGTDANSAVVGADGILGKAVKMKGFNRSCIDLGDKPELEITNSATLSAWVRHDGLPTSSGTIFSKFSQSGDQAEYAFFLNKTGELKVLKSHNGVYGSVESVISNKVFTAEEISKWNHVSLVFKGPTDYEIYINGTLDSAGSFSNSGFFGGTAEAAIGCMRQLAGNNWHRAWNGEIDEVAFWSRDLSATEIQQLYRRGANRVKYQLRACSDSSCSGNPEWVGAGGDGTTFLSELYNRSSTDIDTTFSGCYTSFPDVCDSSEFGLFGDTKSEALNLSIADFPIFDKADLTSRFFQYRVILESEDNSICNSGSEACLPSVSEVSFNPNSVYYGGGAYIKSKVAILIDASPMGIEESKSGSCDITYQFSTDGVNFKYWDGSAWAVVGSSSDSNTASEVSSELSNLGNWPSNLYFKAFLSSNGAEQCSLKKLSVKY